MKLFVANYNPRTVFLLDGLEKWLTENGIEFKKIQKAAPEKIIEQARDAEIFLATNPTVVDKSLLSSLPNLKFILAWGNGYDQVDVDEVNRLEIPMSNAGAYSNPDVAEMALTLIFACGKRLPEHITIAHSRKWTDRLDLHPLYRFTGRTMGLLGFGKIARDLCWRLAGLRFKVLATDPYVSAEEMSEHMAQKVEQEELLRSSDYISLHLRLNDETRNIMDEKSLHQMKRGAYLINVSRGGLIDEEALVKALREGWIAGAGLDVRVKEPPAENDPLSDFPNVILTPHAGAGTEGSKREHVENWSHSVKDFIEGNYPLWNQINPQVKRRF